MNERINLLEPNKDTGASVFLKRLQSMRVVTIGILFLVSATSVMLFILVAISPLPTLQKQLASLEATLAQSKSNIVKLAVVSDQANTANAIVKMRQTPDVTLG